MDKSKTRCGWPGDDPLYIRYHDVEWGVPQFDDRKLFEALILDGAQAGLSWLTILRKRENYRAAFDNFDPVSISRYNDAKINQLLQNEGIIRNRLKIETTVTNAQSYLKVVEKAGSFEKYIWQFVGGVPIINRWRNTQEIPAQTELSAAMSKDLKQKGFRFVGPTICYAFMQAVGMVNDHITSCFRYDEV
ncbi:MAG: DNA-3-methyladenine glycosylase I [Desulfobacteraceae bacterium]|nr:DNA-3-methyladenine glycosylase I [Desulfobacteraceae bacterium]